MWYAEQYTKHKDLPYKITWAKEAKLAKDLLRTFTFDELKLMAEKFLSYDKFADAMAGYTIGVFYSQINKYTSVLKKERKKQVEKIELKYDIKTGKSKCIVTPIQKAGDKG
jgi:hypothetical protein